MFQPLHYCLKAFWAQVNIQKLTCNPTDRIIKNCLSFFWDSTQILVCNFRKWLNRMEKRIYWKTTFGSIWYFMMKSWQHFIKEFASCSPETMSYYVKIPFTFALYVKRSTETQTFSNPGFLDSRWHTESCGELQGLLLDKNVSTNVIQTH